MVFQPSLNYDRILLPFPVTYTMSANSLPEGAAVWHSLELLILCLKVPPFGIV